MKNLLVKKFAPLILGASFVVLAGSGRAQTTIYSDNFNIPDTASLDGSVQTGRHTGSLAANVVGRSGGIQLTITSSNLNLLAATAGSSAGRMRFHDASNTANRWNWASGTAGTQILSDGGMKISFDWTAADNTSANWISYCVGINPATDPALRIIEAGTDSGILLRNNGGAQVFKLGAGGATATFDVTSLTRHVDLNYAFTSWADGTVVTLTAYINGTLVISQTFNWNGNSGVHNMEIASVANGTRIDNFTVTSLAPPPFIAIGTDTAADSPTTNYVGRPVTLSAGIAGTTPVTNQWKVDKGSGFVSIANATNSTLFLANAQITNSGVYKLFASNSAGSTNTSPLTLTFIAAPASNTNQLVNLQFTGFTGGGTPAITQNDNAVIGAIGDVWNTVFSTGGSFAAGTGLTASNGTPIYLKNAGNFGTTISLNYVADYLYNAGAGPFAATSVAGLMSGVAAVQNSRTGTLTVSNLAAGDYDLYLYSQNTSAQIRSSTFVANGVSAVCGPNNSVNTLVAPTNYVHLVPAVTSNGVLTITFTGAANGDAQLNGLQLSGPQAAPTLSLAADTAVSPATVYAGYRPVTISASFVGTQPITNQWKVDTGSGFTPITGATNSTLILTNAQVSNSGNYALFVSNRAGASNSTPVALTVLAAPTNIAFNVQFTGSSFGSGNVPAQTGAAVIGGGADVWNTVSNPTGDANPPAGRARGTNLTLVDVGGIPTTLTMDYVGDYVFNGLAFGQSNPFYNVASPVANLMSGYMGSVTQSGNPAGDTNTITLRNLLPGIYDLYLFANGRNDGQTRVNVYTANGQSAVCGPNSGNFTLTAGVNYVHLTPTVTTNGLLNISYVGTADAGQGLLNGFQVSGPSTDYNIFQTSDTSSDSPATDYVGRTVTFAAAFGGNPTPTLQWKVDKGSGYVNVPNATNSTLTLTNVQTTDTGSYSLFATNTAGGLSSTPLALTVLALPSVMAVNVQFAGTARGSSFAATQVGGAVIGGGSDFWNPVSNPNPTGGNPATPTITGTLLGLADVGSIGTSLGLSYTGNLILNSAAATPFNGSGSPAENLMQACLGVERTNTATVTLSGLRTGTYDLYLYSSAGNALQTEVSQFSANDSVNYFAGPNQSNNVLTLGTNYVHLTPTVTSNGILNLSFVGTVGGLASLNGLQLSGPGAIPLTLTAAFTGTPTNLIAGSSVIFANTSSGSVTNSRWNFGDGNLFTNSSNAGVTHTYAAAGTYTVSLVVTGTGGASTNTQVGYVVVNPLVPPTIGSPVLSGGSLIFSGTGSSGAPYRILSTTNLTVPLAGWTPVWTNVFAPDGSYSYTNSSLSNAADFFRLVSP